MRIEQLSRWLPGASFVLAAVVGFQVGSAYWPPGLRFLGRSWHARLADLIFFATPVQGLELLAAALLLVWAASATGSAAGRDWAAAATVLVGVGLFVTAVIGLVAYGTVTSPELLPGGHSAQAFAQGVGTALLAAITTGLALAAQPGDNGHPQETEASTAPPSVSSLADPAEAPESG